MYTHIIIRMQHMRAKEWSELYTLYIYVYIYPNIYIYIQRMAELIKMRSCHT